MNTSEKATIKQKPFFRHDPATSIVLTLVIFLVSQILAAILLSFYPAFRNWTDAQSRAWLSNSITAQFVYVLLAEAVAVSLVIQLIKRARATYARIGLIKPALRDVGYALVAYGLYFLTYLVVIIIASRFLPGLNTDQEQQIGFESAYSTPELLMAFASLVILPPLAEEFIFRGFLFSSLRAKFRLRFATIITSVLFGIAHLQFGADAPLLWVAAIDTFILSCFLCYLRERTGSLWSPVLLHATKNLVAFTILFGGRIFY